MINETDIESLMSEVILGIVKNPDYETNMKVFCEENHIDRNKITAKKIFRMLNGSLFRLMMGIAQLASLKDYLTMCIRIALITYCVATMDDGSPEAIKKAHEGSPIKRKGKNGNV